MDFSVSERVASIRGVVRDFMKKEVHPLEPTFRRDGFLAVPATAASPLEEGEVYLHELDGFAVRLEDDTPVGLVTGYYETAAGLVIEVQGPKREFLLPYRKEFVTQVDRAARRLVIAPPDGLLDG